MRKAWVALLMMLVAGSPCLAADTYPNKAVHIVVPYGTGNTADIVARVIAQQLSEQLGNIPFVVDNKPGASGIIGNGFVAKSAPDGYTLSLADFSFVTAPSLYKSVPWDSIRDFVPITQVVRGPQLLAVSTALNVKTLKEFITLAQANPGKFNFGSGGTGSGAYLAGELFKSVTKVNLTHVPFKGVAEAATALIGNQVQMLFGSIPVLLNYINAGQVRVLGVTSDAKRWSATPDVPTMLEAGVSGMEYYSWFGFVGPARIPTATVEKIHAETVKALAVPSVKQKLNALGVETIGDNPREFSALINSEIRRWAEVIRISGAQLEQ